MMVVNGTNFGHKVIWVYADTKEPVGEIPRACPKCGKFPNPEGEDPCWGHLPNVKAACCGHGVRDPYVLLLDGTQLNGKAAIDYATGKNCTPVKPFESLYLKAGVQTKVMIHKIADKSLTQVLKADETLHLNSGSTKLLVKISEWKSMRKRTVMK